MTARRAGKTFDCALNVDGLIKARSQSRYTDRRIVFGGSDGATRVAGRFDASGSGAGATGLGGSACMRR